MIAPPAAWFLGGFHRFLNRFLKRHFHAIAVLRDSRIDCGSLQDRPVIIYANHPSWWDPLIAHFLNAALFSPRHFFAPIDAEALQKYKVFEKLGFYGVQLSTQSGAAAFLRNSLAILNRCDSALWITPEGRFADVRDHSAELMPGLSHLCSKCSDVIAIPLALEYVFWDERLPVCLVNLGQPLDAQQHRDWDKAAWGDALRDGLRDAQADLAAASIARSSDPFDNLLTGRRGAGGVYDACRKLKAKLMGKPFDASHGDQFR
ncbi:acyltransferase [Rhodopirellula sp. MGV]|nr:acyltransferase [Rhodopirellula sp. MGV]PNY33957.1 acyltransferase [Rhodopirellula baltica]